MSAGPTTGAGTAVPEAVPAKVEAPRTLRPISWKTPIALSVLGMVSLVVFGLLGPSGRETTYRFSTRSDLLQIPELTLPSRPTVIVLSVLALLLAGLATWLTSQRRKVGTWVPALFGALFIEFVPVYAADVNTALAGVIYGGVLILFMYLLPGGVMGIRRQISGRRRGSQKQDVPAEKQRTEQVKAAGA